MRTSARVAVLVAGLVTGATASAGGARPVSTAALLKLAGQMVLVTTPDWSTVRGTLFAFERGPDGAWQAARLNGVAAATPVAIVVGKNGTAWDASLVPPVPGPIKIEGDGKSPAGVFALGSAFGMAAASEAGWLKLPYVELTPSLECVDDPASGHYNELLARESVDVDWKSSEKMRAIGAAYQWGVVVQHNTSPAVPGRGSCVFLHVGGDGGTGTAGCTAMAEPSLKAVMQWLDPQRAPVLVQLPIDAYNALRTAWSLPALPAPR